MMTMFGIGEIARRANVPASTIRYYEQIGLLPACKRINGKRRYDLSILSKLNVIRLAQNTGFTLGEIQALIHDFPEDTPPATRWHTFSSRKIAELDQIIEQAQRQKAFLTKTDECTCPSLETCATETGNLAEIANFPR